MNSTKRIAVAGAGPAGLTTAYCLAKLGCPVAVYEASSVVGGLSRSIDLWGRSVDLGSHIFHQGIFETDRIWNDVLKEKQYQLTLKRGLLDCGTVHEYPFNPLSLLSSLGILEVLRCAASWAMRDRAAQDERSTESVIVDHYGRRVYDRLLRSYVEKLWGCPGSNVDPTFADLLIDTVPKSPFKALAHSLGHFLASGTMRRRAATFMYPVGGTGALWTGLSSEIERLGGQIHLGAKIDRVIIKDMNITGIDVGGERVDLDFLISSLPIPVLHRAVFAKKAPIHAPRSTILVYLKLDGLEEFEGLWLYLIDPGIRCGRVTNVLAWQPERSNEGKTDMLCLEYWCFSNEEIWMRADDEIAELAESEMRAVGLLKWTSIVNYHIERLHGTHPSYRKGDPKLASDLTQDLKGISGLEMIGRHGSSSLGAMSDAMLDGIRVASKLYEMNDGCPGQ